MYIYIYSDSGNPLDPKGVFAVECFFLKQVHGFKAQHLGTCREHNATDVFQQVRQILHQHITLDLEQKKQQQNVPMILFLLHIDSSFVIFSLVLFIYHFTTNGPYVDALKPSLFHEL